jgi:hypothetical protein
LRGSPIFLALQTNDKDEPGGDLHTIGTVAAIGNGQGQNGGVHVIVEGLMRGKADVTIGPAFAAAMVSAAPEPVEKCRD